MEKIKVELRRCRKLKASIGGWWESFYVCTFFSKYVVTNNIWFLGCIIVDTKPRQN